MRPRIDINRPVRDGQKPQRSGMSQEHLRLIRQMPSCISGLYPCEAHHLLRTEEHGAGRRSSDRWAIPLTVQEHADLHHSGNEDWFLAGRAIDGRALAQALWRATGDREAMLRVVERGRAGARLKGMG